MSQILRFSMRRLLTAIALVAAAAAVASRLPGDETNIIFGTLAVTLLGAGVGTLFGRPVIGASIFFLTAPWWPFPR